MMPQYTSLSSSTMNSDSSDSLDKQLKETHELLDTSKYDAGLQSDFFYKSNLSHLRYSIRSKLIKLVKLETDILYEIQKRSKSKFGDIYFPYTANLASHTFYVLILPIPVWFGNLRLTRDLVIVLGLGIYFSGLLKDYLCLPRPKSPPLHRITLSHYTSKEYGCPSSHCANATGVTLLILQELISNSSNKSFNFNIISFSLLFLYYTSLVFGRIYCGMHGFVDLISGSLIGLSLVIIRNLIGFKWDQLVFSSSILVPIFIIIFYYGLIYYHSIPLDACPCFVDSVSFIGVLLGLELSHWLLSNSRFAYPDPLEPCVIPFNYQELGLLKTITRVLIGVLLIVIWKETSKPILIKFYKPIHDFICFDYLKLSKSKNNFKLKSETDNEQQQQQHVHDHDNEECDAWKPRYDLDIFVRLTVYAGIPFIAVVVCSILFQLFNLNPIY